MSFSTGIVTRTTGSWCNVHLADGRAVACRVRGRLKVKGFRATNPVAVGDRVTIDLRPDSEGNMNVTDVADRSNYIIRRSVNLSKETHIIAANIDLAAIVATVKAPRTSPGFIDRFLITAEAYSIPALIILNKIDTAHPVLSQLYADTYRGIGYEVMFTSATEGTGISELRQRLQGLTTLISGHSGSGKSSLLNALDPDLDLRTGDLSEAHSKGMHTTTFAEMFELDEHTKVIDTPGIKEFGLVDMNARDVSHYFPEIFKVGKLCRFPDCRHMGEPGCAVPAAVEQGTIPESRMASYFSIVDELSIKRNY